jgi:ribosomal protein S18 acetylase RimI-like enzyme
MIRRAAAYDAPELAALAERTFRDAFAHANRPEDMDLQCQSSYSAERQAGEIADPETTTLVCEQDGALVGFGQLRWHAPDAGVIGARPVEIERFYVDRRYHGTGVAQALMAALQDAAAAGAADVLWLGVWEYNPRAIAFYAKAGFTQVGERVFVLGRDPQRDLVLSKNLA